MANKMEQYHKCELCNYYNGIDKCLLRYIPTTNQDTCNKWKSRLLDSDDDELGKQDCPYPTDCPYLYDIYKTCIKCKKDNSKILDKLFIKIKEWEKEINQISEMRDATPEEQEAVDKYIKSISKPTGIDFDEEQEQIDFIQPKKSIPCTVKIQTQADGEYINKKDAMEFFKYDVYVVNELNNMPTVAIPSVEPTDENLHREREQAYMNGYEDACKKYRQVPKTGHWIAQDIYNCHTDFKCSECGYIHSFMHLYGKPTADYTYCPNCGAKMVGEQERGDKE